MLYDSHAVTFSDVRPDPGGVPDSLWIRKNNLPRINEFELKPEGACRADVCIPVPSTIIRGDQFDLTAFARRAGQSVSCGSRRPRLELRRDARRPWLLPQSRVAPQITVPDRTGTLVRLSQFRGKKVLLVTWASW